MIDTNCTRPVLFENEDFVFRFSQRGTAFFVSLGDRAFAVTAYYVVNGFHPSQYRLLRCRQGGECFEYNQPFVGNGEVDDDFYDFVVIPLRAPLATVRNDVFVWPLEYNQTMPSPSDCIWIDGYPDAQRDTHYNDALIEFQGSIIQTCLQANSFWDGIFALRVTSDHPLTTFSGFSGSPAYITPLQNGTMADTRLFGVTIRGTPESRTFYVIGILAVKLLIGEYLRRE